MSRDAKPFCVAISDSVAEGVAAEGGRWTSTLWTFASRGGRRNRHIRHHHLVVARLDEITRELVRSFADLGEGGTSYLLLAKDLPVQAVSERVARLRIGDPHRLHIARAASREDEIDLVQRLARFHAGRMSGHAVFDVWWEHDTLVALSPRFHRLHVPKSKLFAAVPRLAGLSRDQLTAPSIHPDGAYVHWEEVDVHLGWDELNEIVDVQARLKATQKRLAHRRRHGAAIRVLRTERGLTQADIDGLTPRHLRRIEHGEQPLTHKALTALARAHEMQPAAYLDEVARR